jgi:hypothetical protein
MQTDPGEKGFPPDFPEGPLFPTGARDFFDFFFGLKE